MLPHILPIIIFMVVGLGGLLLLRLPLKRLPVAGVVALSFWMGALTITFVIMLAAVITGKILLFLIWPMLLGAMATIYYNWDKIKPAAPMKWPLIEWGQIALSLPLIGLIIYSIYRAASYNMFYEIVAFDAVGNFAMKAKLWYETRELFPPQLLDPEYLTFKRRYPPMVIMSETVWAYLMGRWDGVGLKYFFLASWISSGLLIYALVKPRANIFAAWLAAALWFTVPVNVGYVWIGALTGYGDVPLAVAFLAASLALGLWGELPKGRAQWGAAILTGLMLSSTMWTKKEGLPFIMAAALYIVIRRLPWRQAVLAGGIVAVFLGVIVASVWNLPNHFEKDITLGIPLVEIKYRLGLFNDLMLTEIKKGDVWGERLWYALLLVWLFKFLTLRWREWGTRELYFFAGMGAFYTLVCLLTIFEFKQNYRFLFPRLMLQVYPLLVVATFAGFTPLMPRKSPDETNPTADQQP